MIDPRLRTLILLIAGVAGLFFELVFRHPPDAGMIPIFLGMIGVGPFLPTPSLERSPERSPEPPPPPPTTAVPAATTAVPAAPIPPEPETLP